MNGMKNGYVRIIAITLINLAVAGAYFWVLEQLGALEKVYADPTLFLVVGGGFSGLMIGVALLFYKLVDQKPLRTLGFSLKRKDGLFAAAMSVVTVSSYMLFVKGLELAGLLSIELTDDYFSSHQYLAILPLLIGWFLGALHEEITNRAYFHSNLRHLRLIKLLLVSSLIFAVMHVFKGLDPLYFIILFSGGVTFMYIYVKSGNVWTGTIIHAVMNFSNSFFLNDNPDTQNALILLTNIEETQAYLLLFGFNVALSILLIVLTRISYKKTEKREEALRYPQSAKL
jgi:membrane protease YdiL (CAAX protease family)